MEKLIALNGIFYVIQYGSRIPARTWFYDGIAVKLSGKKDANLSGSNPTLGIVIASTNPRNSNIAKISQDKLFLSLLMEYTIKTKIIHNNNEKYAIVIAIETKTI